MAKGDHKLSTRAKGATGGGYARPRVQIGFDDAQMRRIAALAQRYDKSFAAVVRNLVDRGLDAVGER
jgi:hypothetical protein